MVFLLHYILTTSLKKQTQSPQQLSWSENVMDRLARANNSINLVWKHVLSKPFVSFKFSYLHIYPILKLKKIESKKASKCCNMFRIQKLILHNSILPFNVSYSVIITRHSTSCFSFPSYIYFVYFAMLMFYVVVLLVPLHCNKDRIPDSGAESRAEN